jgi:glycosyltransferase involved in cell wall biosynthesis
MTAGLTVVMPVYNEAGYLPATVDALVEAIARSGFEAELVLVDDGSTDGSAAAAERACAGRLPFRALTQPNRGRFEARRAGLEAAKGEWALLLDSRVTLASGGLAFVAERLDRDEKVWTGHVDIAVDGNPYAVFWKLLAELAWKEYFENPRTTSFDASGFDRFPKGTTCFLAPRRLLLDAVAAFRSRYADTRDANDDTPLIRWIAEREPIHISPSFSCLYQPRTRLHAFARHSFHRGVVFLDGHGRPESRLYPLVVAFYPVSALLCLALVRRPLLAPAAAAAVGAAAAVLAATRRRTPFEVGALAALAPVYAVAHSAGMWRGLALLIRGRLRTRAR